MCCIFKNNYQCTFGAEYVALSLTPAKNLPMPQIKK
jgi:hypothetical protein